MEKLIDRQVPAAALFSGPYYFLEQLGFRKVIDTTFMMASMLTGDPDPEDVREVFPRPAPRAARHRPAARSSTRTTTARNSPRASTSQIDTRRWGPGERIVFEPYTREVFEESFKWIAEREIFDRARRWARGSYQDACVS